MAFTKYSPLFKTFKYQNLSSDRSLKRRSKDKYLKIMKKLLWLGFLIPLFWSCTTQNLDTYTEEKFSISSTYTGQSYEMTVLRPTQFEPNTLYPIIFLLDGHWHYNQVSKDLLDFQEEGIAENVILVGIAYEGLNPNGLEGYGRISELRIDDFTFTKNQPSDTYGGKSEAFRNFLENELLPELQSRYPEDPSERTLMGHSLGGYFGVWEMFTYPENSLFKNIHAGSPALWWDDGYLMNQEREYAASGPGELDFSFHSSMGSMESVVWNTFFDEFEARIDSQQYPGLEYQFERYPKGHAANAEPGFYDALGTFFPVK